MKFELILVSSNTFFDLFAGIMNSKSRFKYRAETNGSTFEVISPKKNNNLNIQTSVEYKNNKFLVQDEKYKSFDAQFDSVVSNVYLMNLPENCVDKVFKLCEQLTSSCFDLMKKLVPMTNQNEISSAKDYIAKKFACRKSTYQRRNLLKVEETYVPPKDTAIGSMWKSTTKCGEELTDHTIVQTAYQYVSIIQTLKAEFSNEKFRKMYFEYNNEKHFCKENVYRDFCCGSVYQKNDFFNPTTIQIELAIDEFDPCDPIKSKKNKHKMCGVYFRIRNIHPNFSSKSENIYLVALINVADLKQHAFYFDVVAKKIVAELKILENDGITIPSDENLNGTLINISMDNLGANSVFGFVQSFAATHFCRICKCEKEETQQMVREDLTKIRKVSEYNSLFPNEEKRNEEIDYTQNYGIKNYSPFNSLQNFHMFRNRTLDVMHDCNEGIIPFFIEIFFDFMITNKFLTVDEIQKRVRDFNYGTKWKKYKPSLIRLKKPRVKQNAMQNYCLLIHLPFIFIDCKDLPFIIDGKDKMRDIWQALEHLLQFMQIVNSTSITDSDIERQKNCIEQHYIFLIVELELKLIPKHHIVLHYGTQTKKTGPMIHGWAMNFERKHKDFTTMVKQTNNFKNLPKTLAQHHQEKLCVSKNRSYEIDIKLSTKTTNILKVRNFDKYKATLDPLLPTVELYAYNFVQCNSFEYRPGLLILKDKKVFEIIFVIVEKNQIFLFCQKYSNVHFDYSLNSIEIEKEENNFVLHKVEKDHFKTYDKVFCQNKVHIIAETLEVYNDFDGI